MQGLAVKENTFLDPGDAQTQSSRSQSTIHVLVQLLTFKFLDETKKTAITLTYHVFYFVATKRLVHDIEFRHVSAV